MAYDATGRAIPSLASHPDHDIWRLHEIRRIGENLMGLAIVPNGCPPDFCMTEEWQLSISADIKPLKKEMSNKLRLGHGKIIVINRGRMGKRKC
jgi:hypothetical protein